MKRGSVTSSKLSSLNLLARRRFLNFNLTSGAIVIVLLFLYCELEFYSFNLFFSNASGWIVVDAS